MDYIIVGLGNPTDEYKNTRHNAGRMALFYFQKKQSFSGWEERKGVLASEGSVEGKDTILLLPETYMNRSGVPVKSYITSQEKEEQLVVVHDDIDLPIGKVKVSFSKSSGGHRGLESVIRSIGTKDFTRLRIGIAPATPSGKVKKPKGEEKVLKYLMSNFTKKEKEKMQNVYKRASGTLAVLIAEGREAAMNKFN